VADLEGTFSPLSVAKMTKYDVVDITGELKDLRERRKNVEDQIDTLRSGEDILAKLQNQNQGRKTLFPPLRPSPIKLDKSNLNSHKMLIPSRLTILTPTRLRVISVESLT
jgi:hypothetical protein